MLKRGSWVISLSACALATCLGLLAETARAELLWRDNFNAPDVTMLQNAPLTGRLSGSLAGDVVAQSSMAHQAISSNQLYMVKSSSAGRMRFQPDLLTNTTSFNWAASSASAAILGAPTFRVEFDWTTPSTTTENWISFNIGHPDGIASAPGIRFDHPETDYSLLLRGNGEVWRADNGAALKIDAFTTSLSQRHVVFDFAFDSYADGSLVNVLASIDGVPIDDYSFTWNNNGGALFMELETLLTGMLIDNLQISTVPEPASLAVWCGLFVGIVSLSLLSARRWRGRVPAPGSSHREKVLRS